jgi:isopentenyl-diphosphate delta-isomerase
VTDKDKLKKRKTDHLKFALSGISQVGDTGFSSYRFIHNALPEIDFGSIKTSTSFLGKNVNYPFFISCMTGGIVKGGSININLAKAAQKYRIPMGVGSQRIAIEHKDLEELFRVRKYAPDIPLLANIGLVQLNYGYGLREFQKCIDMIKADALVIHLNPIQEIIQPDGDKNWKGLLTKLEKIINKLSVPVIAKEVGFGLSEGVVKRLYSVGVRIFDTAGWGGTSWAMVEGLRGKADKDLGELFSRWGIPTAESIKMCAKFKPKLITSSKGRSASGRNHKTLSESEALKSQRPITILGSGGVRNGVDIAKSLVLGADLAGIAAPFAKAALISTEKVGLLIEKYAKELKVSMFGVGAKNITELKKTKLVKD